MVVSGPVDDDHLDWTPSWQEQRMWCLHREEQFVLLPGLEPLPSVKTAKEKKSMHQHTVLERW